FMLNGADDLTTNREDADSTLLGQVDELDHARASTRDGSGGLPLGRGHVRIRDDGDLVQLLTCKLGVRVCGTEREVEVVARRERQTLPHAQDRTILRLVRRAAGCTERYLETEHARPKGPLPFVDD